MIACRNTLCTDSPQSPVMQQMIQQPVAPPAQLQQMIQQPAAPPAPLSPTMVDPFTIAQERQARTVQLEGNLRQAGLDIARQVQMEKQELAQKAALEKANYDAMVDQFVQEQALLMDQQTNMDILRYQQAAVAEKSRLEQHAVALKTEYEARKAEEEMMNRQYVITTEFFERNVPLFSTVQDLRSKMAAHGMPPSTKRPQDPVVPHLCPVPAVLNDFWTQYGYVAPSLAVPFQ